MYNLILKHMVRREGGGGGDEGREGKGEEARVRRGGGEGEEGRGEV